MNLHCWLAVRSGDCGIDFWSGLRHGSLGVRAVERSLYNPAKSFNTAAEGYDDRDATPLARVMGNSAPSCWWLRREGRVARIRSRPMKSFMLAGKSAPGLYSPMGTDSTSAVKGSNLAKTFSP